jgi:uroporphyrin-III C-methyltransferase/precorrin-2 dehydrogenase/sirohydrochlorin ferrochelatase
MRYLPLFLDTRAMRIVVFGGGLPALAKLRLLVRTEAEIHVVGPDFLPEIIELCAETKVVFHRGAFDLTHITGAGLVYAATGDRMFDDHLAAAARAAGVPVNAVDNPVASTVITPAIVDRDPVVVAIGTQGAAPVLARRIKALVEAELSPELGQVVRCAEPHRAAVAARLEGRARRDFWERFFDGSGRRAYAGGGAKAVAAWIAERLAAPAHEAGRVVLVGAGPGDPELLTLKARKLLDAADVVLYDRLVDRRILELARREALFVDVGKSRGTAAAQQSEIDRLLVTHARNGALVVRLKSGDPAIFGRADEEIAACRQANVTVEIVPGVTAASAAAAAVACSLTRRGRNSAFTLLTARDAEGLAEHDWKRLAASPAGMAVYMGVEAATFVQGRLMLHGADRAQPVSIVENASRPDQKIVSGRLDELSALIKTGAITGPAVILIGLGAAVEDRRAVMPPRRRSAGGV